MPQAPGTLAESPSPHAPAVVVPIPVEPSGPAAPERDIAAITYAANPEKKGLDRVLGAWAAARREDEELVVTGTERVPRSRGVRATGPLEPAEYRALLRRARVFVTAPRREDYGVAQLEALADGCLLVTTPAPGPYAALPLAGGLDPRLVGDDLAAALRAALDDPAPDYAERALAAIAPYRRAAVDAVVSAELLPRLLAAARLTSNVGACPGPAAWLSARACAAPRAAPTAACSRRRPWSATPGARSRCPSGCGSSCWGRGRRSR